MRPVFLAAFFVLVVPAHSQNQTNAPKPKLNLLAATPLDTDKVKFLPESGSGRFLRFDEERRQPRFHRRVFFCGLVALGAAKAYDAVTTRSTLDRRGWENNPVYGRHPSVGRQATISAAFFASESALFYGTEHSRRSWKRWTGRIALMFSIEENLRMGACNSKAFHNCYPLMPF